MRFYVTILCLLTLLTPVWAHEETDWVTLNKPGEAHRKLDVFAGEWKTTTSIWMAGPDKPPGVSEGKSTFAWILDGRFMEERTKSFLNFPGPDGKLMKVPFEGRGVMGYDKVRKLYVNTWVDSLSTYIGYQKGQFSADGKTLTLYGEMDEPAMGVFGRTIRIQTVLESENRHVFTMYDLHAGEDYKVMEIVYERI